MEKILLNIDSRQRNYTVYSDSTFFKLDNMSNFNSAYFKNINYISLVSIEFPNMFYVFHESRFNNFFNVTTTYTGGGAPSLHTSKITIPSNNYNIDTLVNTINVQLNDANLNVGTFAGSILNVSDGLKCSVNTNLNIVLFNNLSAGYSFTIDFNNNNNDYVSLGYLLGFRTTSIIVATVAIKGTSMFNIGGENYIFMRINDYGW